MKQQFLKDTTSTIRMSAYQSNVQVVPSAATIVIKDPSGSEVVASVAATVGSDGEMTYSIDSAILATLDLNYIAVWTFTVDGTVYEEKQLFDVVRSILSIPITDDDLYAELDSLRRQAYQKNGTASSATSTTLVDTTNLQEVDDFWNGGMIEIIGGTGVGQKRRISDFANSSSTVTVDDAWTTTPDSTSRFRIIRSYTKQIEATFEEFEQLLVNLGRRPALIMESQEIKTPLTYLAIAKIAMDLSTDEGDKWDRISIKYEDKFNTIFNGLKLNYDTDESGSINSEEEGEGVSTFDIQRT